MSGYSKELVKTTDLLFIK